MFDTLVKIAKSREADPDLFIELVRTVRPSQNGKEKEAVVRFQELVYVLEKDDFLKTGLRMYLRKLFKGRKYSTLIADIGIIGETGFWSEIKKRLYNKILPVQPPEESMDFILSNAFYHPKDHKWFAAIPADEWERFFTVLDFKPISEMDNDSFAVAQVLFSIELLSLRISGTAMDYSLLKMVPEYANLESPFIGLQAEIAQLVAEIKKENTHRLSSDALVKQVNILSKQCKQYLERALRNKEKYGITFFTTIKLVRLQQQLNRLDLLLDFLVLNETKGKRFDKTVRFLHEIIKFNASKNEVLKFWRTTSNLVAYQITQHSGKTGEHYITESTSEYQKMLKSAAGGGVVVGILCLFKLLYASADTSPFGHAFLYSMNYALGFMAIYLLHFTLATKQPAMTAATLAQAIKSPAKDKGKAETNYAGFADLFARLFRSQFIAFVGNVFFAFPTAMLVVILWSKLSGSMPVTETKADKLLTDINFFESKALFHAMIAGVYLFLSGLISGYFINRNIHEHISLRIRKHPFLTKFFTKTTLQKLATFYDKHIGGLSGNFYLGVFLGSTGMLGVFLGLDIDIRHITFAAGNFGIALLGKGFSVSFFTIIMSILCIGLIGFLNFIVSFFLSLTVAMRSRNMNFYELYPIFSAIWQRFKLQKRDFFIPPPKPVLQIGKGKELNEEDVYS